MQCITVMIQVQIRAKNKKHEAEKLRKLAKQEDII